MLTDSDHVQEALRNQSAERLAAVRKSIAAAQSALVAFSGGVDSAFLLKLTVDALGVNAVALTALSASVPEAEAEEAKRFAQTLGAKHVLVSSKELSDPRYAANPTNRCYFCKTELYTLAEAKRAELKLSVVLDGFNADDKVDHRPGHQAAREHSVVSPLKTLTKDEIRAWSKALGLSTWNKPQMPCLASRIPYGTQVTVQRLKQIEVAEASLRAMGLRVFRVRFHDDMARVEVAEDELPRLFDAPFRKQALEAVKAAGFRLAVVDLEPFRSGRLNDHLSQSARALPVV